MWTTAFTICGMHHKPGLQPATIDKLATFLSSPPEAPIDEHRDEHYELDSEMGMEMEQFG